MTAFHCPEPLMEGDPSSPGGANLTEARFIAKRLLAHARLVAAGRERRRACAIAFSRTQAAALRNAIRREFAEAGVSPDLLSPDPDREPFVVAESHELQGIERDMAFVSLGFAPWEGSASGRLGILEKRPDPAKRLNVAMTRARSRTELWTSLSPAHISASRPLSLAGSALLSLLMAMKALALAPETPKTHPDHAFVTDAGRFPGDRLDNLGIVHGWARAGDARYRLGLVLRNERMAPEAWDGAEAHLRATGWTLLVFTSDEMRDDPHCVRTRAALAMAGA